jgi:protein gp37
MGKTNIEYADEVSNPLFARPVGDESVKVGTFCEKPDPNGTCKNCWAEALNLRFGNGFAFDKSDRDKIEWIKREKEMQRLAMRNRQKPMSEKFPGNPLIVFCHDTYDLFQPSISDELRDWVFDNYDMFSNLTILIQTTYVSRMEAYLTKRYPDGMPQQYFIGMSAGTQKFLDDNLRHFLKIPAKRRYLIFEPLLESIYINRGMYRGQIRCTGDCSFNYSRPDCPICHGTGWQQSTPGIHLLIIGGESGTKARSCDLAWIRALVGQAKNAGVAVLVKQLGAKPRGFDQFEHQDNEGYGVEIGGDSGRHLVAPKGGDMSEWPTNLRIRQFPEVSR